MERSETSSIIIPDTIWIPRVRKYITSKKFLDPPSKKNIFFLKLGLWVIQKWWIPEWPPALLSLMFRYVYWIQIRFLLLTNERRQSRRPYRKKQFLQHHICSKIKVVGYPKMIKSQGGRLLFCPWCSDMFIRYKKAFFSKHMNDSKAGGPIEKSNFCSIIFVLKLRLWVIQKW